jgi:hypothetical protein
MCVHTLGPPEHAQGTPDTYSCHPIRIPDSVPDAREFVGVRIGLDGASHLHHVLLMECPADLWFIQDITRNSEMCTTHSGGWAAAAQEGGLGLFAAVPVCCREQRCWAGRQPVWPSGQPVLRYRCQHWASGSAPGLLPSATAICFALQAACSTRATDGAWSAVCALGRSCVRASGWRSSFCVVRLTVLLCCHRPHVCSGPGGLRQRPTTTTPCARRQGSSMRALAR